LLVGLMLLLQAGNGQLDGILLQLVPLQLSASKIVVEALGPRATAARAE
jgi:hypothetical protein